MINWNTHGMPSMSIVDMWQTLLKQHNVTIIRKLYMKIIMTTKLFSTVQILCCLENLIYQCQILSLCQL